MYIKTLRLENFQSHEDLTVELVNGVNVIYGQTDAGKSTIIRAIKWVFFNEPKGDVIRKEGSKVTSVTVTLDNDVIVKKIRSNTVNAYILKVKDEEKRFDAVGKNIPEEVLKALQVSTIEIDNEEVNLNIANQLAMPFLLDKSATFRTKLFNKLTGNDIIDKIFQSLNKDLLSFNKEEKIQTEFLNENNKNLKELEAQSNKVKTLKENFYKEYSTLEDKIKKYKKLNEYKDNLYNIEIDNEHIAERLQLIKIVEQNRIDNIKNSISKLEQYKTLFSNLKANIDNSNYYKTKTIKIPSLDFKTIKEIVDKLLHYKEYKEKLHDISQKHNSITEEIVNVNLKIEEKTAKYKELLKECKICPTCKQNLTVDIVKEINL